MMTILFQVLRCFHDECKAYQVQQAKKVPKFVCKVCQRKQSVLKVLFENESAKECRTVVQELSMRVHDSIQQQNSECLPVYGADRSRSDSLQQENVTITRSISQNNGVQRVSVAKKWNDFVEEEGESGEDSDPSENMTSNIVFSRHEFQKLNQRKRIRDDSSITKRPKSHHDSEQKRARQVGKASSDVKEPESLFIPSKGNVNLSHQQNTRPMCHPPSEPVYQEMTIMPKPTPPPSQLSTKTAKVAISSAWASFVDEDEENDDNDGYFM